MLGIAACLYIVATQSPSQAKITFTSSGATAPTLVAELSKAAGVSLTCAPLFERDVLVLRVKDAPLQEILTKIAEATAGKWEPNDSGWNLVRSAEREKELAAADLARKRAMIERGLKKERDRLARLEPWNQKSAQAYALEIADFVKERRDYDKVVWEKMRAIDQRSPQGRAMTRIMASLTVDDLIGLPDGYKTVFSDKPTRLQRTLPKSTQGAIAEFVREQNIWAEAAEKALPDSEDYSYRPNAAYYKSSAGNGTGKVLLAVSVQSWGGNYNYTFRLQAADAAGRLIGDSSSSITSELFESQEPPSSDPGDEALELSPTAKAFADAISVMRDSRNPKQAPPEISEMLVNPERFEPLSLSAGDALVKTAEFRKQNVVANLPDFANFTFAFIGKQKITPSLVEKTFAALVNDPVKEGSWTSYLPRSLALQRQERLPRTVLGTFLRKVVSEGRASIDAKITLASSIDSEMVAMLAMSQASLLAKGINDYGGDWHTMRLLGSLSQSQRQAMFSSGVDIATLTPPQREVVNKMLFGADSYSDLQPLADSPDDQQLFWGGIKREPTELFSNGIPSGSIMTASESRRTVVFMPERSTSAGFYVAGQGLDANQLSMIMYAKERPGVMPWYDSYPNPTEEKFTFGEQREIQITLNFAKLALLSKTLQDKIPSSSIAVPFNQLPQSFLDEVKKSLEQVRTQYKDVKPGQMGGSGGGGAPPPPPARH